MDHAAEVITAPNLASLLVHITIVIICRFFALPDEARLAMGGARENENLT